MGSPARRGAVRMIAVSAVAAVTAATAAILPATPAGAVPPAPSGTYSSVTASPFRAIDRDECTAALELKAQLDYVGLSQEIEAQGYRLKSGRPVYTSLYWDWSWRITGPDNYFADDDSPDQLYPDAESTWDSLSFCPDDYGHGRVAPGTYTVTGAVSAGSHWDDMCKGSDCQSSYPQLYRRDFTLTFTLTAEGDCAGATAKAAAAKKAVKKAQQALKKAKTPKAKRKARAKLAVKRKQLAKAVELRKSSC